MNPSDLVAANVVLHKLNSAISDLAFVERSRTVDCIQANVDDFAKDKILAFARSVAIKCKTEEIKLLREELRTASIEIEDAYIEQRLQQCRDVRDQYDKTAYDRDQRRPNNYNNGVNAVNAQSELPSVIPFSRGRAE